jgi:hypothetical protein
MQGRREWVTVGYIFSFHHGKNYEAINPRRLLAFDDILLDIVLQITRLGIARTGLCLAIFFIDHLV